MSAHQTDGNQSHLSDADLDALIKKIVQRALANERAHKSAKTYTDQPILQRGADWKKARGTQRPAAGATSDVTRHMAGSSSSRDSAKSPVDPDASVGHSPVDHSHGDTSRVPGASSAATRHRTASKSSHRTSGANQHDLFDYYNDLLNHEFGNPNAYEQPRTSGRTTSPRGMASYGAGASDYVRFGSLSDFGEPDDFVDPYDNDALASFDDEFGEPYGSSGYTEPTWFDAPDSKGATGSSRWPFHSSPTLYWEPAVELPPVLKQLRDLESSAPDGGEPLRGSQLFVAQAKLAADFEDAYPQRVNPAYHYLPTYAELTDSELRAYFTWRTAWRHGTNTDAPTTWVVLMAYEFINGIGCPPGAQVVERLLQLAQTVEQNAQYGSWASVASDLRRWARDYVVYYDLDPKLLKSSKDAAFDRGVMVFRRKERAVLVQKGLLKLADGEADPEPPSDADLWEAAKSLVSFDVDRSPFLREHASSAAAVWENVFTRMVVHCHKRRKVDYVDSLVGEEFAVPATPFAGVPFAETAEPRERTVHLNDAEWVSYRFGRWKHHYGYSYTSTDQSLGKLVHALDREMRVVWDYPRKLKGKPIPRYQETFLTNACQEVREQELQRQREAEEAEKHKLTFDFSKLDVIRASAATTREALLVDEEREDYAPPAEQTATEGAAGTTADTATSQADSSASSANGGAATTTVPAGATHPLGLTDFEYQAAQLILEGKPIDNMLGASTPTKEMLVDSINEKLYDELQDAAFDFADGEPVVIEDYADTIRNLLAQ